VADDKNPMTMLPGTLMKRFDTRSEAEVELLGALRQGLALEMNLVDY
jgi:hypothetical protein